MTKRKDALQKFVPGSSRGPRNARTLLLQMAMEAERQKEIGARIKELRGRIPQPVIAEKVGVTLRAYQAWEAGGGIAWDNYGKLADAFGVDEDYLLYGEREEPGDVSQLDRIEAKLDTIMRALELSTDEPGEALEREMQEAAERAERHTSDTAATRRAPRRSGRAH